MAVTIAKANYPALLSSTSVSGKDLVLYINYGTSASADSPVWVKVGGLTSCELQLSAEVSTQATIDDGMWTNGTLTSKSASLSANVIMKRDDVGQAAIAEFLLQDEISNEKGALQFAVVDITSKDYVKITAIPTSWNKSASAENMITMSLDATIIGAPVEASNFTA